MKQLANSKRELILAGITRPDTSAFKLRSLSRDYTQVVFVAAQGSEADCQALNGNVYNIEDLLAYDNPLYRTSHPNCTCEFVPYEQESPLGEQV